MPSNTHSAGQEPDNTSVNISKMAINRAMYELDAKSLVINVAHFMRISGLGVQKEFLDLIPLQSDEGASSDDH